MTACVLKEIKNGSSIPLQVCSEVTVNSAAICQVMTR